MPTSALERLARCSDATEIWFDSSPLIYPSWRQEFLSQHSADDGLDLAGALDRLYRPESPTAGYLRGSTTNQPLALQALDSLWPEFESWIIAAHHDHPNWTPKDLAWETFREVAKRGADLLLPIFEASGRRYGYICAQVDPRLSGETAAMVEQGEGLNRASPNIMIKMPGTGAGIEGVRRLAAKGIPTNMTLAYTVSQLLALAEAAEAGKREAEAKGVDQSGWRSCATMMLGRFEDHPVFKEQARQAGIELTEADLRWAGIAVLKRAYRLYKERGYSTKILAASMRVGPVVDGKTRIWHLEKFSGGDVVLSIFPNIIEAFLLAYQGEDIGGHMDEPVPDEVLEKLRRVPYFRQAYDEDGLASDEYAAFPPLVATAEGFTKAMSDFEARVFALAERTRG